MDIISTANSYANVLTGLMTAQAQETKDTEQVSSGDVASDLQGYAGQSDTLLAMQSVQSQVNGYLSSGQVLTAKLSTQDSALQELSGASSSASSAVSNALAAGSGTTLMQALQGAFGTAVDALNTTYNGEHLFSGGQVNTEAVSATSMSDLTSAASVASVFNNDSVVQTAQVDQGTTVSTGFLASNLGTTLFSAFQAIQAYNDGPNGPLTGTLTTAQSTFLQGQMGAINSATTAINAAAAQNGETQSEVSTAQTDLSNQQTSLQGLIGDVTNVNMAQAVTNLQEAQQAVQAAAQAFSVLQGSSLLNVLTASPSVG